MAADKCVWILLLMASSAYRESSAVTLEVEVCPARPCFWGESDRKFSCPDGGCYTIPEDIDDTAEEVYLQKNNISTIPCYLDLYQCKVLDLAENVISHIDDNAFYYCASMELLSLAGNKLTTLGDHYFKDLDELRYLYLNANQITHINANVFEMDLKYSLERLDLSDNVISELDHNAFSDLQALKYLHLQNNNIQDINMKHFAGLQSLQELELDRNQIQMIPNDTFTALTGLIFLDLAYNNISSFECHSFRGLTNLKILNLAANNIKFLLPEYFRDVSALESLHLDYNPLITINPVTLPVGLLNITITHMDHLNSIAEGAFSGIDKLEWVHITDCKALTELSPAIFDQGAVIRHLSLANNNLASLERHIVNWNHVKSADLSGNRWKCDCMFEWIKEINLPEKNRSAIMCSHPAHLSGKSVAEVDFDEFVCSRYTTLGGVNGIALGLIVVVTLIFVSSMTLFIFKYRRQVLPCWFGKAGKYIALYNANDTEDAVTTGENRATSIVKNRNTLPAPVAV